MTDTGTALSGRRRSIGRLLSGLGALLGVLLVGLAASNAWREHAVWSRATAASDVSMAADQLLVAMERMTLERGLTNTALASDRPAAPAATQAIRARRAEAEAALAAMRKALSASGTASSVDLAPLDTALAAVASLRQRADAMIDRPKPDRDGDLHRAWYPTLTAGIAAMNDTWLAMTQRIARFDAMIAAYNDIKRLAAVMREYSGRERALIGASVASGTAPSAGRRLETIDWRARTSLAWDQLRTAVPADAMPAELRAALGEVEKSFFGTYTNLRDRAIAELEAGRPTGITPAEWTSQSNRGLDSIVAVRDAAMVASRDHLDGRLAQARRAMFSDLGLALIAVLLTLAVHVIARSWIATPLSQVTVAINGIVEGRADVSLPISRRNDEIGAIARALAVFHDQTLRVGAIEEERRTAEDRERQARRAAMETMADAFETSVGAIATTVSSTASQVRDAAQALSEAAANSHALTATGAASSQHASRNVSTVAVASDELAGYAAQMGAQVAESSRIALTAVEQAEATDRRMSELSECASRIGEVVKIIDQIAAQTNLLALNATIEAARAGEAGKGFAVVAGEVKALANQTGRATQDIATQIQAMQVAAGQSIAAIKGIQTTILDISRIASLLDAAVRQQCATTERITENVREAAARTQEVAEVNTTVNGNAAATGAAADQLLTSAAELAERGQMLSREVENFLGRVRAA